MSLNSIPHVLIVPIRYRLYISNKEKKILLRYKDTLLYIYIYKTSNFGHHKYFLLHTSTALE